MKLIPTTATAVEKLKRLAKSKRKVAKSSLAVALDGVAEEHGYLNWKHVTWCAEQTKLISPPQRAAVDGLPPEVARFLKAAEEANPASQQTREAFQGGFIFAFDIKDADSIALEDVIACDDAWVMAARDILPISMYVEDDEAGRSLADLLEGQELVDATTDQLMNYRFFRYIGAQVPSSVDSAFATVLSGSFFPPLYLWLRGRFIDMTQVPEMRVGGDIVYSSSAVGVVLSSPAESVTERPMTGEHLPRDVSRRPAGIIPRLDISKIESGDYSYRLSYYDDELSADAGFGSIREAIEAAADIEGDILGFEVGYAGLSVGTFPLKTLITSAEEVAQKAVATAAILQAE